VYGLYGSFLDEGRYLEGFKSVHVGFQTWNPTTQHLTTAALHIERYRAGSVHVSASVRALPMHRLAPSLWAPVLQCVLLVAICSYDARRVRNVYHEQRPWVDYHVFALISTCLQVASPCRAVHFATSGPRGRKLTRLDAGARNRSPPPSCSWCCSS
jgi:hypothetical protein